MADCTGAAKGKVKITARRKKAGSDKWEEQKLITQGDVTEEEAAKIKAALNNANNTEES